MIYRRMFETLQEETEISLKEMEEKTNKKLEDINKSPKEKPRKSKQTYERKYSRHES